jgi:hypothetical protein
LDKKGTVQTRHDYIETQYVDGVKNEAGETVIRKMTDDEKAWLSQFIAETEHGNVNKGREIKVELKKRKALKSDWASAKRKGNVEIMLKLEQEMSQITSKLEQLRENSNNFYTKEEDVTEIFGRDYERRSDVYNNAKISDNLVLYDIDEYDKFSTEAIDSIDPENLILEHLQYIPVRKRGKR